MYNFITETQGLDTFRVCEIEMKTQLDTAGLGMLLNNKIAGLCPVSSIQMDNRRFIRYNISSQIPLKQFFMEKVDKKRFLRILHNILTAIENIEDYMLDPGMLILEKEEIYVNVGTLQTDLIYYPVMEEKNDFDIHLFVKNLIMSTEFDIEEQDNYVTLLISYLNHTEHLTVSALKEYIAALMQDEAEKTVSRNIPTPAMVQKPVMPVPDIQMQQPIAQEVFLYQEIAPMQNQIQVPIREDISSQETDKDTGKKKGFFFGWEAKPKKEKEKKEKVKKEKVIKEKVKKEKPGKEITAPGGIVIPHMDNTKNSTLPEPPKPTGAPVLSQMVIPQQEKHTQPAIIQNNVRTGAAGETGVLGTGISGATTVLSEGYNTVQRQRNPYLFRKKTNERVEINRNIFRIGKESSYVDYCISDNTAVSRSHADIIRKNDEFYIVDNNSLNHTFLNGVQIPSSQMYKLEDYMIIKLADEIFEFTL